MNCGKHWGTIRNVDPGVWKAFRDEASRQGLTSREALELAVRSWRLTAEVPLVQLQRLKAVAALQGVPVEQALREATNLWIERRNNYERTVF